MIDIELDKAGALARICIMNRRWWSPDFSLETEQWQKYTSVIAPYLSDADWNAVVSAFIAVGRLRTIGEPRPTDAITDETADSLASLLQEIDKGSNALALHHFDLPPALTPTKRQRRS